MRPSLVGGGLAVLALFCFIETRVEDPMFRLALFRIRPFTAGNLAALLSGLGRGGLMFILIIWLQGIYLPMHGYDFTVTPLWAGIGMGLFASPNRAGITNSLPAERRGVGAGMSATFQNFSMVCTRRPRTRRRGRGQRFPPPNRILPMIVALYRGLPI